MVRPSEIGGDRGETAALRGFVCGGGERYRCEEARAARERIGRELASLPAGAGWLRRLWLRPLLWLRRELRVLLAQREFDERLWLRAR